MPTTSTYIYSKKNLFITFAGVVFLVLSYYAAGTPSWVGRIDVSYLMAPTFQKIHVLFSPELVAWMLVLFTQALIFFTFLSDAKGDDGILFPRAIVFVDAFFFIVVVFYHLFMILSFNEGALPRLFLSIFSAIMFRQILINISALALQTFPTLLKTVRSIASSGANLLLLGKEVKDSVAHSITFLLLTVISLIVWSPALLPSGLSPRFVALGVSVAVALISFLITFSVQRKLMLSIDKTIIPLEEEIFRASALVPRDKDEADRINGLIAIRDEIRKISRLPMLTIVVGVLQGFAAFTSIMLALFHTQT